MDLSGLLLAQVTDVFRIGLLAALIYTTSRTRAQSGILLPLIAGIVFVAVIIPATQPLPGVLLWQAAIAGLFVNTAIVALLWLIWQSFNKRS